MEVAAIARNIARALNLNEDLAETIALAHDLGHAPFGHKGEDVLNELMQDDGGFEHNRQSLRIVEELEEKYPGFRGLNLTYETREGLAKHRTTWDKPGRRRRFVGKSPSLEAQVANLADELTYGSHDLDDGLEAGLLNEKRLHREVKLWAEAARAVRDETADLPDETRRYFILRCLIDGQVRDVVETTEAAILASGVKSADDVRLQPRPLVQHSPRRRRLNLELRAFLLHNLYSNPMVFQPNNRAGVMLGDLFQYYLEHPREIGLSSQKRARRAGWLRAICDYLSGMTDRYAILEHQRLFGAKAT
jgi:dGTPase